MAATAQSEAHVSLKLVVNEETNTVLFVEAGKDFVDVLCSFLTFPLATVVRLVQEESSIGPVTVGCLNSLYQSLEDHKQECLLHPMVIKQLPLKPPPSQSYCTNLKLNIDDPEPTYFTCPKAECTHNLVSTCEDKKCLCGELFTHQVFKTNFRGGFVNDDLTFLITDDLTVMPNSIQHTNHLLLSTSSVKEMIVNVTKEKVLDLFKCSLLSKTALTDSFLRKLPLLEMSRFSPCHIQREDITNIQMKVRIVVRISDGKLVYVHGEKEFADFLISCLTYPLGTAVRLLGGESCVGSLDGLYQSIANLNENYFMSTEAKNSLIDPRLASHLKLRNHILTTYKAYQDGSFKESSIGNKFYLTEEHMGPGGCVEMALANPETFAGYFKRKATYFVTDDLVFTPVYPISALHYLQRLGIPFNDLDQKRATIGFKECLSILKASLTSTSALTDGLRHLI